MTRNSGWKAIDAEIAAGRASEKRTLTAATTIQGQRDQRHIGTANRRRHLVDHVGTMGQAVMYFKDLSGEAYLLTGLHPKGDDAVSQLVSALRQAADEVSDPDEKSNLCKLADGVGSVSRDMLSGVLTTVITTAGRGMIG
jgi:hypothetical protein